MSHDVYKSVDCDGDGVMDHACSTTINNNRWLVLSTEGCPNSWGTSGRALSKCPKAWTKSKFILTYSRRLKCIIVLSYYSHCLGFLIFIVMVTLLA